MAGSVSCKREIVAEGTSNASTTTAASTVSREPVVSEFVFCSPVTSIVNVWLLLLRPIAVKTGTRSSLDRENKSTSDTKTPSTKTWAMPLLLLR